MVNQANSGGTTWLPAPDPVGDESYEIFESITGSTITPALAIPATDREWRINLYRTGVRMTYGLDFTITDDDIVLTVAGQDEAFVLIIK